jgi:uncharacterized protein
MTIAPTETVSMRTRDGVRLDADLYRPEGAGPFPVLLMRQPYGRKIASTICYAHPSWYAAQGYIVVIQDVRGRGSSEGRFRLFADDIEDGADSIGWAAQLPDSSGAVGMYGFSYQGTNQLLAAAGGPSPLKALAPAMIGWDIARDWAYENDAFCLSAGLGWAIQMAAENARLANDGAAFAALHEASRALPVDAPIAARPDVIDRFRNYAHYHDWLENPPGSPYWRAISPAARSADVHLPMLFVGGWYDSHLPGTIAAFRHFAARDPSRTRIVIGPWGHFPWGRRFAGVDFGAAAVTAIDQLQVRWFDHWLKGHDTGLLATAPVKLFDLGAKTWREFPNWPGAASNLFLSGAGRASIDEMDGKLVGEPPATDGIDYLVHDPWRPVPAVGGAHGNPPGPVDRAAIDARADVLTFTGPPLAMPMTVAGDIEAALHVVSDAASFDVSCVLSRLAPDGRAMPLAQGYRLVKAGNDLQEPVGVPMRATFCTLNPGDRLRLSVAAACFPAYPINPGTGADPTTTATGKARIITLGVRHGGAAPSRIRYSTISTSS